MRSSSGSRSLSSMSSFCGNAGGDEPSAALMLVLLAERIQKMTYDWMVAQQTKWAHRLQHLYRAFVRSRQDARGSQQTCWIAVVNWSDEVSERFGGCHRASIPH